MVLLASRLSFGVDGPDVLPGEWLIPFIPLLAVKECFGVRAKESSCESDGDCDCDLAWSDSAEAA